MPGMKIPRGGEQRDATDLRATTHRQSKGEKPSHAIAEDTDLAIRHPTRGGKGALQPPRHVAGEVEIAFVLSGGAPVDDDRPQTVAGEMPKKAALRQEIEDVVAID